MDEHHALKNFFSLKNDKIYHFIIIFATRISNLRMSV